MSVSSGPALVERGLVYAYDMGNGSKSWRGAPTTNLYYAVNNYLNGNGNHWVNSGGYSLTDNDTSEVPPYISYGNTLPTNLRITSATTTTVGNQHIGMGITSVSPSTTYTMSIWVKTSHSVWQAGPYMRTSVNNNQIASFSYNGDTNWLNWPTGRWIRITATGTTQSNENGIYLSSYIGDNVGHKISYYGYQVEQKSFATPLVAGTRSNTQAIVDMTGNHTITATGLTYNTDGTFSWSAGTDARLQSPSATTFSFGVSGLTLECWIKPTNFSNYTHMIALPDQNTLALKANVSDGAIYFYSPSFTTYPISGWTLTVGAWNHVVLTRFDNVAYCYLNGVLKGTKSGFNNSFTAQTLNIGNGWPNEYTAKDIASVKIYNRALQPDEVRQNFNALRSRFGI